MELKEFITATIEQLVDAIEVSNERINQKGASVNPCYLTGDEPLNEPIMMNFDVALTARDDATIGGSGSLRVMAFGIDGRASKSASSDKVSRVQFAIPVQLPAGKKLGVFEPPSGVRTRARGN